MRKEEDKTLKYEGLELPENLSHILQQDFWMLDNIGGSALAMLHLPMKFTSTTVIFVKKGHCKAEINLQEYDIKAPCGVIIASSEIMQPISISEDFEGAFIVMSSRFIHDFKRELADTALFDQLRNHHIVHIPPDQVTDFEMLCRQLKNLTADTESKYSYQAVLHTFLAFFYHSVVKCLNKERENASTAGHLTQRFMKLARENFKKERFMEFYAREMGITSKHLSRTIKAHTGFTASEWLDRMVVLEAKVLLKSSTMSIQQISEELNFPSQSFFGKYFKNIVGVSPKEFRNAR